MSDHSALDAAIAALGIEYRAVFVPLSQSRNAGGERPTINWRVYLSRNGAALDTDYMQGSGYIPLPAGVNYRTVYGDELIRGACESGRAGHFGQKLKAPTLRDVLFCLIADAGAIDAASFEDWAADYGYDPDSRAAERIYNECLALGLKLRRLIGDAGIATLREAFQDY